MTDKVEPNRATQLKCHEVEQKPLKYYFLKLTVESLCFATTEPVQQDIMVSGKISWSKADERSKRISWIAHLPPPNLSSDRDSFSVIYQHKPR